VPLNHSALPANYADGGNGHTSAHNATNTAVNAIGAYVDASVQPLDADLTTIAALDSSTAGALTTDGSGWVRKTYAQLKTALGLVKADVGLGNVDNTADTAKPISTATQAALDAKVATAALTPQDSGLISWSSDPTYPNANTVLTNGTIYLTRVQVRAAATLNNIYWWVGAAAVTATSGQNFVGVYDSTGTRVATTGVDANITSTGMKTTAVTPVGLTTGFYWVAMVFNAGTAPGLTRGTSATGVSAATNVGLAAATLRYATNATAQTSLPTSITPASNTATAFAGPWVAIG
jgi:hypothetical protein